MTSRLDDWLGPVAGPELAAYLDGHRPGWRDEVDDLHPPRHLSPPPDGAVFDLEAVDRFLRFCRTLRHIKGPYAGRTLELDLWQIVFVAAPLFGWLKPDGTRVYSTLYLEVPRKNGKSTLAAAIALYLLAADRESGPEVVAAAGDREQAGAVYGVSAAMARRSPAFRKRFQIGKRAIWRESTAASYKVLSADADLKHGLNLNGAIVDELHVHKKRDLLEVLETSTGSRAQPIVAILTTAGVDDPGSIYTERHDYAIKVASGELDDPELLTVIYTIGDDDDPLDPAAWHKANPGYGTALRPEYLAKQARKARASNAAYATFCRLHLNVITGTNVRYIDLDRWDTAAGDLTPDLERLEARTAYGGLDLASVTDLASAVFVVPRPDDPELLDVFVKAWTPADTLEQRAERDRAPYVEWVRQGWLTATPGAAIDFDVIESDLGKIASALSVSSVSFDRWGSKQLVTHLRDGGLNMVEMGQGFGSMSDPTKTLERLVLEERLRHAGNPVLRWAVRSLSVKMDPAGNLKPDRSKSTGRIDPAVALIMALDAWSRRPQRRSAYEDRGLTVA